MFCLESFFTRNSVKIQFILTPLIELSVPTRRPLERGLGSEFQFYLNLGKLLPSSGPQFPSIKWEKVGPGTCVNF